MNKDIEALEFKRSVAKFFMVAYHKKSDFLKKMYFQSRIKPLTERQCEACINIGERMQKVKTK